jgi:hypothetical protein
MRRMKIIRILIGLNLMIFLLPFFNTCSNTPLRRENIEIKKNIKNSQLSKEDRSQLLNDENERFEDQKRINDEYVMNAYQLAITPFKNPDKKMFEKSYFYFSLCYTIQILSIIFIFFLIVKNKSVNIKRMILINIALLFLSLIIAISGNLLGYIDQIKIGFYVYLFNLLIIYMLILKKKKKKKENKNEYGRTAA